MPIVSAHYAPPSTSGIPIDPEAPKQVWAFDEQGRQWSLTEDSLVGDWLRYIEGGGTIDPAPVAKANVKRTPK